MDEHCGSHFDCGPEACCLEPNHSGKRGFTDSGIIGLKRARSNSFISVSFFKAIYICQAIVPH